MASHTRRTFIRTAGMGAVGWAAVRPSLVKHDTRVMHLYVGTYTTGGNSEGIYLLRMNAETGALTLERVIKGVVNPSFLAVDGTQRYLYAVNETAEYEGRPGGAVSAFAIDGRTGDLRFLNRRPSQGGAPCHVAVDRSNRYVLVANYLGGNAVVLPVQPDGGLGPAAAVVQHEGSGPNRQRQEAPHAHSVTLAPDNRFAFVADLGIDRLMIYGFDTEGGALTPGPQPWAQVKPGAGPRHFAFHPDGRRAYVINELDATITAFTYDPAEGRLQDTQTISTLPEDFSGENACADIHVDAGGRFVYGSNRGHDSIAVFAVDERTGRLSPVQHEPTQGRTPRNFALDPASRFLLAANQNSDTITVFAIDSETGRLSPTGHEAQVPVPVCLRFLEPHA